MRNIVFIVVFLAVLSFNGFANVDVGMDISSVVAIGSQDGKVKYNLLSSKFMFSSELSSTAKVYSSILGRFSTTIEGVNYVTFEFGKIVYMNPVLFDLYEGYLQVDGFLLNNVNLVIGKQRISWGKSDKVNPTDVLNPFDLYNFVEFYEKFPSWALNTKVFLPIFDETYIQIVLNPLFEPAKFNTSFVSRYRDEIKREVVSSLVGYSVVYLNTEPFGELERFSYDITNGLVGFKVASRFMGFDVSASFVSRKNDIPYVGKVSMSNDVEIKVTNLLPLSSETNISVNSLNYFMGYHRENMIGFDLSKDFGFAVGWIEVGVFIPEEVYTEYESLSRVISIAPMPGGTNTNYIFTNYSNVYLKDSYTKYVFGFDKTFDNGFYVNFQFAHGLGIERGFGNERLQDYFILVLEKKFFDDTLKIRAYSILNVDDFWVRFRDSNVWNSFVDNSSVLGGIEISYYPVIGTKVFVSLVGIDGNGDTMLSKFEDFDVVDVGFSMEF